MTLSVLTVALCAGCSLPGSTNNQLMTPERLENGLVIILPGIEGESPLNLDIRNGLMIGGVPGAMPIYHWGRPIPVAGPLINQMDFVGNRLESKRIAQMIVEYQDNHPGKPVYLIGHSGGGGMAVFAAESLPEDRKVDGLILLSASISKDYDLSAAMDHCRCGIVNFYSSADFGLLVIGTTLTSNVDGARGPSAGATGFERPKRAKDDYTRLWQVELAASESSGWAHAATTRSDFVSMSVAPWVLSTAWPPQESARR